MLRNTKYEIRNTRNTPTFTSRIKKYSSFTPALRAGASVIHHSSFTDSLTGLLLFLAGMYAYTGTLAPTVIEGDAALFQYTPYVLGVTYPTGFPLYILLSKLWVSLIPFGEVAWRMNLFSAFCSAAALPILYNAIRRLVTHPKYSAGSERWAAPAAVLIFATLPTFWRWSTEAKTYALNILLFSGLLYTLARALEAIPIPDEPSSSKMRRWFKPFPMVLPTLFLGLQISVHNTGVLLIPGLVLLAWLNFRAYFRSLKSIAGQLLLLVIPGLFYLYIPLRAEWLIAARTRQDAIEQGLLADFYTSGPAGLVSYFTASGFTGGVVTNWGLVPQQFFTVYLPLLTKDLTMIGAILGLVGGLALAVSQPRRFFPLLLIYALPIPFVLAYGQGEQSAFLLPSFLVFCIFAGYALISLAQGLAALTHYALRIPALTRKGAGASVTKYAIRNTQYVSRFTPPLLLIALAPLLFYPQIQHNVTWLSIKWNRDIFNEWADALNHPLDTGSGMLAHWGDLTSFWYMQHAENRRPDLRGVYPPDEAVVINWFERGNNNLFIAGPLQGWAAGIEERYQFIPWGRLVRIAPRRLNPQSLLPSLPHQPDITFGRRLHLIGADFAAQAAAGQNYPVTLTWQALQELGEKATVSLRLTQNDIVVAQLDDRLRSGWFPRKTLPVGQHLLSYPLLHVPVGTLPGRYRLQLVTYEQADRPWTMPNGSVVLDLGPVEIISPPADYQLDSDSYKTVASHDFNNEIQLAGFNYSVARVGQGKGFALHLLWQAKNRPVDSYLLRVEQLDAAGNVLRATQVQPLDGRAPTTSWQPGQFIGDQVNLVVPAGAPPGEKALRVRLSWLRPNGTRLNLRRWGIPVGDGLNLPWLRVTKKKARVFDLPNIQHALDANFENKALLAGFNSPDAAQGSPPAFKLNQSDCVSGACSINLDFYWQGLNEMESPYQIFTHLVDANNRLVTQYDHKPGVDGRQPTTGWLPGEVILDPVEITIPANLAAGQYTLRVGLYRPSGETRLQVTDSNNQHVADFVAAGEIEITPE